MRKQGRVLLVVSILCLFILFQGCNSLECKSDKDCATKSHCYRGKCVSDCLLSEDCEAGKSCSSRGKCVDDEHAASQSDTAKTVPTDNKDNEKQTGECKKGESQHCFEGDPLLLKTGICQQGVQICVNGSWGACLGQLLPSKEICDNKDNDCDGQIDESLIGCDCVGDSDCPAIKPNCRTGICVKFCQGNQECENNEFCHHGSCQPCSGDSNRSKQEECNGKDDDCDGFTDEDSCSSDQRCNPNTKRCESKSKCDSDSCSPNTKCNQKTGKCEKVDLCQGVICSQGRTCDKNDGKCKSSDSGCSQDSCPRGQKCNPNTKKCESVDRCKGVLCPQGEVCDQAQGICKRVSCMQSGCLSGEKCDTATGLCKEWCYTHSDCLSGEFCIVKTGKCEKGCRSNSDCKNSSLICSQGKCISEHLSNTCTEPSQCSSGYYCSGLGGSSGLSFCVRECTGNASICSPSSSCTSLENGRSICLTYVGKGKSCDRDKGIFCERNQALPLYCSKSSGTCKEVSLQKSVGDACTLTIQGDPPKVCDVSKGLICDETTSKCKKSILAGLHEQCSTQKLCDVTKNLRCLILDSGVGHGYCFTSCSGPNDASCKGRCLALANGSHVCLAGTKKEGGLCSSHPANAEKYDASESCGTGLSCFKGEGLKSHGSRYVKYGVCAKTSNQGCATLNCSTGYECVSSGFGGHVCLKSCRSNAKACKIPGTVCESLHSGGNLSCIAKPVYGPNKQGELCNPGSDIAKSGCTDGNQCLATNEGKTKGFCAEVCYMTCQPVKNSSGQTIQGLCQALGRGSYRCLFPCSSSRKTPCPDGMVCKAISNTSEVCLPK